MGRGRGTHPGWGSHRQGQFGVSVWPGLPDYGKPNPQPRPTYPKGSPSYRLKGAPWGSGARVSRVQGPSCWKRCGGGMGLPNGVALGSASLQDCCPSSP